MTVDRLSELIAALRTPPSVDELADALWLADWLVPEPERGRQPPPVSGDRRDPVPADSSGGGKPTPGRPGGPAARPEPPPTPPPRAGGTDEARAPPRMPPRPPRGPARPPAPGRLRARRRR